VGREIYSDLTDLLGLSDRRASRRKIRLMASKLFPFKSGRRRKISSRAAASAGLICFSHIVAHYWIIELMDAAEKGTPRSLKIPRCASSAEISLSDL
jgi:hypothetical protein